jgi:hypothetical protein
MVCRSWRKPFAHEDHGAAVGLAPLGLYVASSAIDADVFGHQRVRVQPYLAEAEPTRLGLSEIQELAAQPTPLVSRVDGHILQEQVVSAGDQHQDADALAGLLQQPGRALADHH